MHKPLPYEPIHVDSVPIFKKSECKMKQICFKVLDKFTVCYYMDFEFLLFIMQRFHPYSFHL